MTSNSKIASCQLVCLQKTHDPVQLPDGETIIIGRSPQTQVTDPRCSRRQLEVTANWKLRTASVRQIGSNASTIDGTDIGPNQVATMGIDSTLFILSSLYPHKIVFQQVQDSSPTKQNSNSHVYKFEEKSLKESEKKLTNKSSSTDKKRAESESRRDSGTHMKDMKANSSSTQSKTIPSKRSTGDSNEQPVTKKIKIEQSCAQTKVSGNTNGEIGKPHISAKSHNSTPSGLSSAKEENTKSSSKSRIKDITCEKIQGHSAMESDDNDEHVARIKSKLNKMKQDALSEQAKIQGKSNPKTTDKLSLQGPLTKSNSSNLKTSQSQSSAIKSSSSSESLSHSHKRALPSPLTATSEKLSPSSWDYNVDHYVFTSKGVVSRPKIAGFDLDGTIIGTKSGKTFPIDADDWKIFMPEIFHKLKDLHANNFKIVFFTNQLGVAKGKIKIEDLIKKIQNVVSKLQVPVQVFIATHEGRFRKPMTGMWEKLVSHYNHGISIDLEASIYVGDAAGRQANWAPKKKKDFSCSDRLFALNIGIAFKTPEEYFQNQKPTSLITMPEFDPKKLSSDAKLLSKDSKLVSESKEAIILVGFPASGKSHFAKHVLEPKGYIVISRDTLGSWQKCVKRAQEALVNSSVVIDNTNLSKEERARYIDCAKKSQVPCRCFVFTTTVEHCRHNERFRQMTNKSHEKINELVFNQTKKRFEEPSMNEGFTDIVNVNFVPHFSSDQDEADYRKFLLEK